MSSNVLQMYGWWHLLRERIRFTPFLFERNAGRRLALDCGVLLFVAWMLGKDFYQRS